jgi:hypothetical protein
MQHSEVIRRMREILMAQRIHERRLVTLLGNIEKTGVQGPAELVMKKNPFEDEDLDEDDEDQPIVPGGPTFRERADALVAKTPGEEDEPAFVIAQAKQKVEYYKGEKDKAAQRLSMCSHLINQWEAIAEAQQFPESSTS